MASELKKETIQCANAGLKRYYEIQGVKDFNNKFLEWCDDNEYDDDAVTEEFEENPSESIMVDFDEDFPLQKTNNRQEVIMGIIKECFCNLEAFMNASEEKISFPKWDANTFDVAKVDFAKIIEKYKTQCPVVFNSGMQEDTAFLTTLAIGYLNNFEYLQYIVGDYFRTAIKHNNDKQKTLMTPQWKQQCQHFIKYLNEIKKSPKASKSPSEIVEAAVKSFSNRVCPKLMFQPLVAIQDSLEETAKYITFAVEWVHKLAVDKQGTCPFQVDVCIGFPATKPMENKVDFDLDDDDDDDDDEDDVDGHGGSSNNQYFDCIGNIHEKLEINKLKYVTQQTETTKETRIFGETYDKFVKKVTSEQKEDVNVSKPGIYPRNKRFISFIDRRDIDNNKITMYEPPSNARDIPRDAVPEWYLSSSRTCILPNKSYDAEKAESGQKPLESTGNATKAQLMAANITCQSHCKGALMTLSFHVKQSDRIACYLYINGQITRFLPEDIINVLPIFFDKEWNDKANVLWLEQEKKNKTLIKQMKGKLVDCGFNKFTKCKY